MFSKTFRIFGQSMTSSDLIALGAFGIGAVVTFLDFIGVWDSWGLKPVEVVILLLITVLILYSIQEKWEIARRNEDLQRIVLSYGTVGIIKGESEIFNSAAERLRKGEEYDVLRVYAPVGLWRRSDAKEKWFRAIGNSLNQGTQTVTELRAIFGLPSNVSVFDEVVVQELQHFKDRDGARLRFIPPLSHINKEMPGTGIVIFGNKAIGFGFAVHGHHTVVDSTVFIEKEEIVKEVNLWFDGVWETVKDFPLKEARRELTLEQGLQNARACYQAHP